MSDNVQTQEAIMGHPFLGIPVSCETTDAASIFNFVEMGRMCLEEKHLRYALSQVGLELGSAQYIKDFHAYYQVSRTGSATTSKRAEPEAIEAILRDVPRLAQSAADERRPNVIATSKGDTKASGDCFKDRDDRRETTGSNDDAARLRREVGRGPARIKFGGEDLAWSDAVGDVPSEGNAAHGPITCQVTNPEHHLVADHGRRIRPAHPDEATDIVAGSEVELSQVVTETVHVAYLVDGSEGQLDFGPNYSD